MLLLGAHRLLADGITIDAVNGAGRLEGRLDADLSLRQVSESQIGWVGAHLTAVFYPVARAESIRCSPRKRGGGAGGAQVAQPLRCRAALDGRTQAEAEAVSSRAVLGRRPRRTARSTALRA